MDSSVIDMLVKGTAEGQFVCVDVEELLHGCVRCVEERNGWVRPWRFSSEQVRTMGSCLAWHPGLFRQMARTTAGVTLELTTDSTELAIEVLLDGEPSCTRSVLDPIRGAGDDPLDGISADVDGRHIPASMPDEAESVVQLSLDDPDQAPLPGLVMLPGLGDVHHVRVWLPALRGCAVRRVWGNGTFVTPVDQRSQLLVIGDSIAQGFVTGDPATAWPNLLADSFDLDVVNQGLGGQVFQTGTLLGLASLVDPVAVVVALGENYRYEPCRARPTARDVRNYFVEVARIWPEVPTFVCTPLWHDEASYPSHAMSCWERVPSMIAANVSAHDEMMLVDGQRLLDHRPDLLADGYEHPNERGSRQVAQRMEVLMRSTMQDPSQLRPLATELLQDAPRAAFPLVDALRRDIGRVVFAEDGCVLLDVDGALSLLYATDREMGEAVLALYADTPVVGLLGDAVDEAAVRMAGFVNTTACHVAVYRRRARLRLPVGKEARVLDETFFAAIRQHYSYNDLLPDDLLMASLRRGDFFGAFVDDELVGFIGEHPEGAFGILEVFEGHRREGWARTLESAKINQMLERGQTPWCEVFPDNEASLALQRALGLADYPADDLRFAFAPLGGGDGFVSDEEDKMA
ncbi:MAG: GNAT family N-acetyltransferase [Atopobiaceae bacterium]|nr:GNAT family N-acetyltransferase [Atopobiaceae bacterium]